VLGKLKQWTLGGAWYWYRLENFIEYKPLKSSTIKLDMIRIRESLRANISE
jgi:hypothetical protein